MLDHARGAGECLAARAVKLRNGAAGVSSFVMKRFLHSILTAGGRRHEVARYVLAGGVNTILTYLIYLACLTFTSYRPAYTISFASGILISYALNAQFVFQEKVRLGKGLLFACAYCLQYLCGLGLLYLLVEYLSISKVIAPLLLILVIVPSNYLFNRWLLKGAVRSR